MLGQISRAVYSLCQKPVTLTVVLTLCFQCHRLSSTASWARHRAEPMCFVRSELAQRRASRGVAASWGLGGNWTVTMHICLVFLHAAEGFISRPVCHTYTRSQPGFSSGPEPITAFWLHSSEKQRRDHAQLQVSAQAPLQPPCLLVGWVLAFLL